MKVSYLFLPTGFEEIEVATVVDILRRADVEIKTVSMTDGTEVTGRINFSLWPMKHMKK